MRYATLLFLIFFHLYSHAQSALSAELIANIEARIDNGHSPSIVVGVVDAEGAHYYSFGKTTQDGSPVDEHTIYEIGSISKTFTGILLAHMVETGKVSLDDPVQKYLPKSVRMPKWKDQEITLGQLSDHTSSLPRLPTNFAPADMSNPYVDYTVDDLYEFLNTYELTRAIGSEYEYSNLAQGLLGHVLGLVAGKTYEELIKEVIAAPLGMQETSIELSPAMQQQLAPGHSMGMPVPNWDLPTLAGAGAIRSSLHDMLIYISANLGFTESPLYPVMEQAHQPRHSKQGNNQVGLAWVTSKGQDGEIVWHNGGTGGYRTFAGFVRETGKGVVVLTNSNKGADDIGFHLLDPQAKLIEVKKSLTTAIRKAIDASGPENAWSVYSKVKEEGTEVYDLSESEINNLGYYYLESGNTPAAIAVFKINVDAFPKSFNVYDSYGEALMKDGQKEAAIANYQKSLELNPGNTQGREMLKKMGAEPKMMEVVMEESKLETFVGTYQIQPGFAIEITRQGKQLFGQATGQGKFELFPTSETKFYVKIVEAQVEFVEEDGKVVSLTLYQNGQSIPGKKVK